MPKQNYTREEVIAIIHNLLQMPDTLEDALYNEETIYDAAELLTLAEN